MSYPWLVRTSLPVCSSWDKISSIRLQFTSALMIAERFCREICSGSYIRVTTSRNIKNVRTLISPLTRSILPTTATVPMPSFRIICAEQTKAALVNSRTAACFSTAFIFLVSPFMYESVMLYERKSRTVSSPSWIPSRQFTL